MSNIILPPVMKKRRCPKGNTQTIIGLPKKKNAKSFKNKLSTEIDTMILEWFVGRDVAISAMKSQMYVKEEHVEVKPELVSSSYKYWPSLVLYR